MRERDSDTFHLRTTSPSKVFVSKTQNTKLAEEGTVKLRIVLHFPLQNRLQLTSFTMQVFRDAQVPGMK